MSPRRRYHVVIADPDEERVKVFRATIEERFAIQISVVGG
jgi:hypothetical protein